MIGDGLLCMATLICYDPALKADCVVALGRHTSIPEGAYHVLYLNDNIARPLDSIDDVVATIIKAYRRVIANEEGYVYTDAHEAFWTWRIKEWNAHCSRPTS